MKTIFKVTMVGVALGIMLIGDIRGGAPFPLRLVRDAQAIVGLPFTPVSVAGVARRTTRRTMAVAGAATATAATASAAASQQQAAAAQQQAAAAQQQTAAAQQQTAAAQQQAAAAAAAPPPPPPSAATAAGEPLPLGTVVNSLPPGCVSTPVAGVEYQYCGGNFYRAVFQGNNLVYVTAKP